MNLAKFFEKILPCLGKKKNKETTPAFNIMLHPNFLEPPDDHNTQNGFIIQGVCLPEKVFATIFSYVPIEDILNLQLVCKSWCRLLRSDKFWWKYYLMTSNENLRGFPWYMYYAMSAGRMYKGISKSSEMRKLFDKCSGFPAGVAEFTDGHLGNSKMLADVLQPTHASKDSLLMYIARTQKPTVYLSEKYTNDDFGEKVDECLRNPSKRWVKWHRLVTEDEEYSVENLAELSLDEVKKTDIDDERYLAVFNNIKFMLQNDMN